MAAIVTLNAVKGVTSRQDVCGISSARFRREEGIKMTCYMCEAKATGVEHAPPRCLFPEQKDVPGVDLRKNLISVPSCDAHNSQKSKDDEYLLFVLISHFENNTVAEKLMRTKILRALKRRPNLAGIYTSETKRVVLGGQPTSAFRLDLNRIERELDHVARGLYFHEFREKWNRRIAVHSPAWLALEGPDPQFVNTTTQTMANTAALFFKNHPRKGDNPDVFWYQLDAKPGSERLLVRMLFYHGVEVVAFSDPKLKENVKQHGESDADEPRVSP